MINRHVGGDFFQPLSFEVRTKDAPPVDLFAKTFGPSPHLEPVLGSTAMVERLYTRVRKAK